MNNEKFRIDIVGDLDYEYLIADIYFEDQILMVLTQEDGFQNMRIRIYPPKNKPFWEFKIDDLIAIVNQGKMRLWELRKMLDNE